MATRYGGVDSTILIGVDTLVITAKHYGSNWIIGTAVLNGVSQNLNLAGTTDIDISGVILEISLTKILSYKYIFYFKCKFKNTFNSYTKDFNLGSTDFFRVISTSGPGSDEVANTSSFIGKLPILREVLI